MSGLSAKSLAIQPRMSEKGFALSQNRVYVMEIEGTMNKQSAKRAVESQFDVTVTKVNMINAKGKAKRTISKQGRRVALGRTNDLKKAYVTLAEGQSLPFYEAIVEEEKKAEKVQEQLAKEIEKQDKPKRRTTKKAKE